MDDGEAEDDDMSGDDMVGDGVVGDGIADGDIADWAKATPQSSCVPPKMASVSMIRLAR